MRVASLAWASNGERARHGLRGAPAGSSNLAPVPSGRHGSVETLSRTRTRHGSHEHPHAPPFVASGAQQRDFSAGAQQAVRSSVAQQADSEVVLSADSAEIGSAVTAMVVPVAAGGRNGRDESMDMNEPRVGF